eukprot:scaffold2417_cov155-Amphora_coffeaeformis.AAC.5
MADNSGINDVAISGRPVVGFHRNLVPYWCLPATNDRQTSRPPHFSLSCFVGGSPPANNTQRNGCNKQRATTAQAATGAAVSSATL